MHQILLHFDRVFIARPIKTRRANILFQLFLAGCRILPRVAIFSEERGCDHIHALISALCCQLCRNSQRRLPLLRAMMASTVAALLDGILDPSDSICLQIE
jgi:hypothetical protein